MHRLWLIGIGLFPSLAFAQEKPAASSYEVPIYAEGKLIRVEQVKVAKHKAAQRLPNYSAPFQFNGKTYHWMLIQRQQ